MSTNDKNHNFVDSLKAPHLLVDMLLTTGATLATSIAAMITVALLARILERDDFLSYAMLIRYFSLAIVIFGVGTGFSFIGRKCNKQDDEQIAVVLLQVLLIGIGLGFIPWVLISVWLSAVSEIWPVWSILGYFWVVAHTMFILSGPVARARGGVTNYVSLALCCRTAPYVSGAGLVLLTGEFIGLFVGFGAFSTYCLWRFWAQSNVSILAPPNWLAARSLLQFGMTRWFDDVARTMLPVALILAASFFIGSDEAAVVALVYLVARVLESMLQPLVISLMMRGRRISVSSLRLDLWRVGLFSLILSVLLFTFQGAIIEIFCWLLGDTYRDVAGMAWLMLMSASPIISLNYLRGCYDSHFSHSPVFFINLLFIGILVCIVMWCENEYEVILSAVLVHAVRLVCYASVLALLLRKERGVTL